MNLDWWIAPWRSEANVWLVVSAFFVALACALPGVFLILRRMALAGDAISHSVLPGIVVAFLFTGSLDSPLLVAGAAASGLIAMLVIEGLHRGAGLREDAAIGIAFTAFFALGVLLLRNYAGKVDLDPDCVLFGSLETAVHGEQWVIAGHEIPRVAASGVLTVAGVIVFLTLGFPTLLISSFDPGHARTAGFRPALTNVLLMALVAVVVVVAFQAVGAILAVALNCNVAAAIVLAGAGVFVAAWLFGPMDGIWRLKKKPLGKITP